MLLILQNLFRGIKFVTTDTNSLDDKIKKVEKKIPDISVLASKTELTADKNKIPGVSGLATTSALTTVENKIPDITNLIIKTDSDTKLKSARIELLIINQKT